MSIRSIKTVKESMTTMTEMVFQTHINGTGRLFGGQLMSWMDIAGAICAKRHSHYDVVTASVEKFEFLRPALPNDVVVIKAKIKSVGKTSMKVEVTAEIEQFGNRKSRMKTCTADFVFVALGEDGTKQIVPLIDTSEE